MGEGGGTEGVTERVRERVRERGKVRERVGQIEVGGGRGHGLREGRGRDREKEMGRDRQTDRDRQTHSKRQRQRVSFTRLCQPVESVLKSAVAVIHFRIILTDKKDKKEEEIMVRFIRLKNKERCFYRDCRKET